MTKKLGRLMAGVLFFVLLLSPRGVQAQDVAWGLGTIIFDGMNPTEKYENPLREAAKFINNYSRFNIVPHLHIASTSHTYTYWDCPEGLKTCVVVMKDDVNPLEWNAIPTKDSYLLLWAAVGHPPLQAGSTFGVSTGVFKDGLQRPYASVPVDVWWYTDQPFGGFDSRAGQILTHELINTINAKLEVAPYNCDPLTPDLSAADAYASEKSRLRKLTPGCYTKYSGR